MQQERLSNDVEKIEKLEQQLSVARDHIKDLEEALEHEVSIKCLFRLKN
jgi:uncharacterized protein (UPF0335 family)